MLARKDQRFQSTVWRLLWFTSEWLAHTHEPWYYFVSSSSPKPELTRPSLAQGVVPAGACLDRADKAQPSGIVQLSNLSSRRYAPNFPRPFVMTAPVKASGAREKGITTSASARGSRIQQPADLQPMAPVCFDDEKAFLNGVHYFPPGQGKLRHCTVRSRRAVSRA